MSLDLKQYGETLEKTYADFCWKSDGLWYGDTAFIIKDKEPEFPCKIN